MQPIKSLLDSWGSISLKISMRVPPYWSPTVLRIRNVVRIELWDNLKPRCGRQTSQQLFLVHNPHAPSPRWQRVRSRVLSRRPWTAAHSSVLRPVPTHVKWAALSCARQSRLSQLETSWSLLHCSGSGSGSGTLSGTALGLAEQAAAYVRLVKHRFHFHALGLVTQVRLVQRVLA